VRHDPSIIRSNGGSNEGSEQGSLDQQLRNMSRPPKKKRVCEDCNREYQPNGPTQRRCEECRPKHEVELRRRHSRDSNRRARERKNGAGPATESAERAAPAPEPTLQEEVAALRAEVERLRAMVDASGMSALDITVQSVVQALVSIGQGDRRSLAELTSKE